MADMDGLWHALGILNVQILKKLYSEESVCVCKLVDMFDISQSKLSYHLKMLLSANLIDKTSQGKWNYYSVNKDSISRVLTYDVIQKLFL